MKNNIYTVSLFGHRDFDAHIILEERLFSILKDLISSERHVNIYIGRNGEFDIFSASVVKRAKKGAENISLTLILPYLVKDVEFYEKYYDDIIVLDLKNVHPKAKITKRNQYMVEVCDLFVCYVDRATGGAYSALKYAEKLNKKIINLAMSEI